MKIDLSHKSICELRFDQTKVESDEAIVAGRVESLNASNNRITHITGLAAFFHRLVYLDLSHNHLGTTLSPVACAWIDALPPSLCVLNIAHNRLTAFSRHGTAGDSGGRRSAPCSVAGVGEAVRIALERLRSACPLTLALFFNCERFPHLTELDISYNAFCLTLDSSDAVEAMLQDAVGNSPASTAHWEHEHAMWLRSTTSSVKVLRLDGNTHLQAPNGMLWGMKALIHLSLVNSGVEDLAAISAAATLCPQLRTLELRGSPVVDAILHAPKETLSTFAELLLLPEFFGVDKNDAKIDEKNDMIAEQNKIQLILREVTQNYFKHIEAVFLQKKIAGCDKLANVIYAALIQQVIPQLAEVDGGVSINTLRRAFVDAARDIFHLHMEKNDSLATVKAKRVRDRSRALIAPAESFLAGKQDSNAKELGDIDNVLRTDFKHTKNNDKFASSIKNNAGTVLGTGRSRSAQGIMTRAAAAAVASASASLPIRPAVLVTGSNSTAIVDPSSVFFCNTTSTNTSHTKSSHDSYCGRVYKGSEVATVTADPSSSSSSSSKGTNGCEGLNGGVYNHNNEKFLRDQRNGVASRPHSVAVFTPNAQSDTSSISEEKGSGAGRFQRALDALRPVLLHRLQAEVDSKTGSCANRGNKRNECSSLNRDCETSEEFASSLTTDTSIAMDLLKQQAQFLEQALLDSQDRQRSMQATVSQLKEQLRQDRLLIIDQRKEAARLREELDYLIEENKSTMRRLHKRQKEIAHGVTALRRQDTVAQQKVALEYIEREENLLRRAERRLREKMALSGVWSRSNTADTSLQNGTTTAVGLETSPQRKTRSDLLRERAVRERIDALRSEEPFAYTTRRFRISEHSVGGGNEKSSLLTTGIPTEAECSDEQCNGKRVLFRDDGKLPLSRKLGGGAVNNQQCGEPLALCEMGHSAYERSTTANKNSNTGSSNNNNCGVNGAVGNDGDSDDAGKGGVKQLTGVDSQSIWLQGLSLQQLFDRAAAIEQRQRVLQQQMRNASDGGSTHIDGDGGCRKPADLLTKCNGRRGVITDKDTFCNDDDGDDDDVENEYCNGEDTCGDGDAGAELKTNTQSPSVVADKKKTRTLPVQSVSPTIDCTYIHGLNNTSIKKTGENNVNCSDDDDNASVDVVVLVADSQPNKDFFPATVDTSLAKIEENIEVLQDKNRRLGEHLSIDARSIYEEIMRQQRQHEIKEKKEEEERRE